MAKSQKQLERIGYVPVQNPYSRWRRAGGHLVGLGGAGASLGLGAVGTRRALEAAANASTLKGALVRGGLGVASGWAGTGGALGSLHLGSKLRRGRHVFARNNSPETQAKWRRIYRERGQGAFSQPTHFQYVAEFQAAQQRKPRNDGYMVVQSPDSPLRKAGVVLMGAGSVGLVGAGLGTATLPFVANRARKAIGKHQKSLVTPSQPFGAKELWPVNQLYFKSKNEAAKEFFGQTKGIRNALAKIGKSKKFLVPAGVAAAGAGLYGLHRTARARGERALLNPRPSLQTQAKWRNRWKARGYHD